MPIIGLTDRGASFPQIGVLRKGAPKPETGNRPGADLNHFRFDTDDADAANAFAAVYGAEPRAIRVFVPYRTTDENFEAWQEAWTAGALQHRCDGKTCVRWLTPQQTYSSAPKPCPGGCKPAGRLRVIIPELRRMAYVMVLTTSIHDIITIQENLEALEAARGDLRGIPMLLRRVPREISMPDDRNGKRVRREKWLLTIEAQPQWVDLQIAAQERAALPAPLPALPEPATYVDAATGEIIEATDSTDAATFVPPEPTRREKLLARIADLTAQAVEADIEIELTIPLDQMTDDQLVDHGTRLKAAIDAARAPVAA